VTVADQIWNRAASERGGTAPRSGDRALASLLLVHGLVMNGGVHHALESAGPAELAAAAEGFEFFAFYDVAALFHGAADDPVLSKWTDETEVTANLRYENLIPSDSYLNARFEEVLAERPAEFAPL
jgi:hypothetical protein